MRQDSSTVLAADIGGTNGRFALFEAGGGSHRPALLRAETLPTRSFTSFPELARAAMEVLGHPRPQAAVLAVAGPVERGRACRAPNIAYGFDLDALPAGLLPGRSLLVNDFTAQAHGCRLLGEAGSREVLPGRMDEELTQAVVGPGTGLGKAALVPDGRGGYAVCGSEGGHAAFPFNGRAEQDFQNFAADALNEPFVRWESVVSGSGLALIHRYLTGEELTPREVSGRLSGDHATARWFARFLGRALRDYALEVLARGGVYVSGGVAAKNGWLLDMPEMAREFRASATHGALMAAIPVRLVADESVGLMGAAALASRLAVGEAR